MRAFWRLFQLEWRALVRSRALPLLTLAAVAWMLALPSVVRSDGTLEGARYLYVRYALGGVFALVLVSLAAAAAGSLSKERAAGRLALTLVRPVPAFTVAFGRWAALVSAGAGVLALAAGILFATVHANDRPCRHVLSPELESPRAEAEKMYEVFMADPATPAQVKRAKKAAVVRLLTQKAIDHYQTVPAGATVSWPFRSRHLLSAPPASLSARFRFSNTLDTRNTIVGAFRFGAWSGAVSNITQAVVTVPLSADGEAAPVDSAVLSFSNTAGGGLMLRPRCDVNVLVEADAFGMNLLRAWCQLVSALALVVAFALFLGASLGRSVAVFVVMAVLLVTEAGPGVIDRHPDVLGATVRDRIGLTMMRGVETLTRPFTALHPLASLAADECVEAGETAGALAVDFALLPVLLCLAAAGVMPRKRD